MKDDQVAKLEYYLWILDTVLVGSGSWLFKRIFNEDDSFENASLHV